MWLFICIQGGTLIILANLEPSKFTDLNLGKQEMMREREAWRVVSMGPQRVGHDFLAIEQQQEQKKKRL